MTKEGLIKKLQFGFGMGQARYFKEIEDIVNDYHELNIVIHKGENRHPYAYEIHAWAEGIPVEWRYNEACDWDTSEFDDYEYRIKPPEPVYEWQWLIEDVITKEQFIPQGHHRLDELLLEKSIVVVRKIEETKRERKQ